MIKSIMILYGVFLFFGVAVYAGADQFMSADEARKRWGNKEFVVAEFGKGDAMTRASMAASLIGSKLLVGKPILEIREKLGKQTGYYFSDLIPAYAVGDIGPDRKETWQIVFLPDDTSKTIKDIKIHKKCCDR